MLADQQARRPVLARRQRRSCTASSKPLRAWGRYDFIELVASRLIAIPAASCCWPRRVRRLLRAQRAFKNSTAHKRYFALVSWHGSRRGPYDVDAALVNNRLASGESMSRSRKRTASPRMSRFAVQARYRAGLALMEVADLLRPHPPDPRPRPGAGPPGRRRHASTASAKISKPVRGLGPQAHVPALAFPAVCRPTKSSES